jgi:hypothetical protein
MIWKPGDATITRDPDRLEHQRRDLRAALDGPTGTAGNEGPAGNFTVTNFSRGEQLKDAMTLDVELSPSSANGWMTTT